MGAFPFIEVTVNGRPVNGVFYQRLKSARIVDAPGQDSDTISVTLDDAGNDLIMPAKGDSLVARFGFRDGLGAKMGRFILEQPEISFGPEGAFITLNGRAADMREDVKQTESENFDDQTIGAIVEDLAGRHGFETKISPELAGIKLPYLARANQSTLDFLTRLADRHRALFAIKDGKFLFLTRGLLPAITIHRSQCSAGRFTLNPRPILGATEAAWFDRDQAKWVVESHATGLAGPLRRQRMSFASQDEAKAAAEAQGERANRATASGSIELAGRPDIMADTMLNLIGFRPEANGLWTAASVTHAYDDTYKTSIELEAPKEGKI